MARRNPRTQPTHPTSGPRTANLTLLIFSELDMFAGPSYCGISAVRRAEGGFSRHSFATFGWAAEHPPGTRMPRREGWRSARRRVESSVASRAVDGFTQQVGVAVVAGILLDHVQQDPADADLPATFGDHDVQ